MTWSAIGVLMLILISMSRHHVNNIKDLVMYHPCTINTFKQAHVSSSEPRHDRTKKRVVRPAKTQISLGIRPVWSESSPSAWRKLGFLATHWTHSEDSDQTGRMPRLIWVFAGRTHILLVLSCRGSSLYDAMWISKEKLCKILASSCFGHVFPSYLAFRCTPQE